MMVMLKRIMIIRRKWSRRKVRMMIFVYPRITFMGTVAVITVRTVTMTVVVIGMTVRTVTMAISKTVPVTMTVVIMTMAVAITISRAVAVSTTMTATVLTRMMVAKVEIRGRVTDDDVVVVVVVVHHFFIFPFVPFFEFADESRRPSSFALDPFRTNSLFHLFYDFS